MYFFDRIIKMPLWLGFLIIAVPTVLFFIFTTPIGWGLDEQVHAPRIYQISKGNFYPDFSGQVAGGNISVNYQKAFGVGWEKSNMVNRAQHPYIRSDINLEPEAKNLANMPLEGPVQFYDFGASGPYTPFAYIPSATGVAAGSLFSMSVGHTVTLARTLQAVSYLLLASLALYFTRGLKLRWLVFSLALLPSSLYQASVLSADAITIGISLLFSAIILRTFITKQKLSLRWMVTLVALGACLALVKQSYALLSLLLLFIPSSKFESKQIMIKFKAIGFMAWLVLLVVSSMMGLSYSDTIAAYRGELAANISVGEQTIWVMSHPIAFLGVFFKTLAVNGAPWFDSFIGVFGYTTIPVPFIASLTIFASLLIAALYAEPPYDKRNVYYIFIAGLGSAFAAIFLLYATFNVVGASEIAGVQGRYFIPCALLILYGAAKLFDIKVIASNRLIKCVAVFGACFSLIATIMAYVITLY
jgi:uncharacterized membrane protein